MLGTVSSGFVLAVLVGTPIAFAIGFISAFYIIAIEGLAPGVVVRTMFYGLDSSVFLAIPLFMMMGMFCEKSGVLEDLVRWLELLVGRLKGGIAYVNVLASMLFAGVSGSSVADVASMGALEARLMRTAGYNAVFSAALTASSAVIGIIIPPSIGMIIYALAVGKVSIGGLFLAGVIPGIALGIALLGLSAIYVRGQTSIKPRERRTRQIFLSEFRQRTKRVAGFLLLPVFVLGSIIFGIATVTESAAIGALYMLLYGVFVTRQINRATIVETLIWTAKMTSVVAMLVGSGALLGWILTRNDVTALVADQLVAISRDPTFFMLVVAGGLFVLGMFLDPVALTVALAPLLAPVAQTYGIDPLHFGLVFILTVQIGMITPPVGTLIILTSVIHDVPYGKLCLGIWPFVLAEVLVVVAVIIFPPLTTWIPAIAKLG